MNSAPELSTDNAIQLTGVKHTYKNASRLMEIPEWQVVAGEKLFLHGPSGSGKTTLLNLLAGVLEPDDGQITLLGTEVSALSSRQRDKFRARHIGVVFQQFNLVPHLSVLKNIELAAHFAGNKQDVSQPAKAMLEALNLPATVLQQTASSLSVGQQQRVAIARALINEPEILLVDEPTSALDSDARDAFMTMLIALCKQANTTLIFVSHDKALERYLDRSVSLATLCQFRSVS